MGVISIGASLGVVVPVDNGAANAPAPARRPVNAGNGAVAAASTNAPVAVPTSAASGHSRHHGAPVSSSPAQPSTSGPHQTNEYYVPTPRRQRSVRKRPVPITTSNAPGNASTSRSTGSMSSALPNSTTRSPRGADKSSPTTRVQSAARGTSSSAAVLTDSSAVHGHQVTRHVTIRTNTDPRGVVPNVIGSKGARINAIMSQAKCHIVYQQPSSADAAAEATAASLDEASRTPASYALSFIVSADSVRRIDHGVKLLQSAVESAEQLLTRQGYVGGESLAGRSAAESLGLRPIAHPYDHSGREKRSMRSAGTQNDPYRPTECSPSSRSTRKRPLPSEAPEDPRAGVQDREDRLPKRDRRSQDQRDADDRIASTEQSESTSTQPGEDQEEYAAILRRGVECSRYLAAQVQRARLQVVREQRAYDRMVEKARLAEQKRRFADGIIRMQCSIMAQPNTSRSVKKKLTQLNAIAETRKRMSWRQPKSMHLRKKPHRSMQSRWHMNPQEELDTKIEDALSPELMQLYQRIRQLHHATCQRDAPVEDSVELDIDDTGSVDEQGQLPMTEEQEGTQSTALNDISRRSCEAEGESLSSRKDSFRVNDQVPGLHQDLNLIQDYSAETQCKLLKRLIGQRQYFYLEPIAVQDAASSSSSARSGLLSTNDLTRLWSFIKDHAELPSAAARCLHAQYEPLVVVELDPSSIMFSQSKRSEWTKMQQQLLSLHTLMLGVHLLGMHLRSLHAIQKKSPGQWQQSMEAKEEDILSETTLTSDVFKFILRPIRSSAIEMSLFDSLPVSLVRETVAHCPELINHVLEWKEDQDVPAEILKDVVALKRPESTNERPPGSQGTDRPRSTYLFQLASQLIRSFRAMGGILKGLCAYADEMDSRLAPVTSKQLEASLQSINRLKSVAASVLRDVTALQLHKWASVFVANDCNWFDQLLDDMMDTDRSYDKFTCLQDALYVWHNLQLVYSSKDDFFTSRPNETTAVGSATANTPDKSTENPAADGNTEEETVLAALDRITPSSMVSQVQSFSAEDVKKHWMSAARLKTCQQQLCDSLLKVRKLMKILGRNAQWRSHLKQSNALKRELVKQANIEKRLILHQWACFYQRFPSRLQASSGVDGLATGAKQEANDRVPQDEDNAIERGAPTTEEEETANTDEDAHVDTQKKQPSRADSNMAHQATGDADGSANTANQEHNDADDDPPEKREMKRLRREILHASQQMMASMATQKLGQDRQLLVQECTALAESCVAVLSKFLADDDEAVPTTTARKPSTKGNASSGVATAHAASTRPRKGSAGSKAERASTKRKARCVSRDHGIEKDEQSDGKEQSQGEGDRPRAPKKRAMSVDSSFAKKRTSQESSSSEASSVAGGKLGVRPSFVPSVAGRSRSRASSTVSTSTSASSSVNTTSSAPLRMGCSGCRDTRKRCTGCAGCCLHCVCVSCGCRMCCSTRLSAVQKTLHSLVADVEAKEACKWPTRVASRRKCGMLRTCSDCEHCSRHCSCKQRSRRSLRTRSQSRKKEAAAARAPRKGKASAGSAEKPSESGGNRDDGNPPQGDHVEFDATEFAMPEPARKVEQEDLLRAARVRMKLQRTALPKPLGPFGMIPPNTVLDGDLLWQPERIRCMWERRDFYGVLGLSRDAPLPQIKRQYRKLVLKLHPDKASDSLTSASQLASNEGACQVVSNDDRVAAFVAVTHSYKFLSEDPSGQSFPATAMAPIWRSRMPHQAPYPSHPAYSYGGSYPFSNMN